MSSSSTNKSKEKKKASVLKTIKDNPVVAVHLSKLVKDNKKPNATKSALDSITPNSLVKIHDSLNSKSSNIESIFQLFPDMELAVQILISSIMSPKNMTENELYYSFLDTYVSPHIASSVLNEIKKHIEKHYNVSGKLPTILRETLFTKGAYATAILPESSIDEVINSGVTISEEELKEFMNNDNGVSDLKMLDTSICSIEDLEMEVSDNYELLKIPGLMVSNKKRENRTAITGDRYSFEDIVPSIKEFYLTDTSEPKPNIKITSDNRRTSVGKPLILKLPMESVIPVHVPGDPTDHLGYFLMLDDNGNPVTNRSKIDVSSAGLDKLLSENKSNKLITKAKNTLVGQSIKEPTIDNLVDVFSDLVEKDLADRMEKGSYAKNAEVTGSKSLFRVMFARSLKNHNTKLLFIPIDLMSYYVYKHAENGTGKSMMDDLLIITSIRSILLFSRVMGSVKGSIPITEVKVKLDENDPDPLKTIEKVMTEVLATRQQSLPIGINSPVDLVDWIHRSGIEVDWEGHPGMPDLHLDFETKKFEHSAPDTELDDALRKQSIMTFGLSPEMVDSAYDAEFATSVVANNLLLSKRVKQIQDIFIPQVTDNIKKIVYADYSLRDKIIDILEANVTEVMTSIKKIFKVKVSKEDQGSYLNWIAEHMIDNLSVKLPAPESSTLETMTEEFGTYKDALEVALESWISEEIFADEVAGDISTYIEPFKEIIKAYYLRKWMAENNYMPELGDMVSVDDDGTPVFDLVAENEEHLKTLIVSLGEFMKKTKKTRNKANKTVDKLDGEEEEAPSDITDEDDETTIDDETDVTDDEDEVGDDSIPGDEEEPAADDTLEA